MGRIGRRGNEAVGKERREGVPIGIGVKDACVVGGIDGVGNGSDNGDGVAVAARMEVEMVDWDEEKGSFLNISGGVSNLDASDNTDEPMLPSSR
mmetsp:Transcript_3785/g.6621  ORF Transcript_3785/g.6621 Transcript_3785/m.6621 type:complete len:94 (-) Transcript_3785:611-892(-)